MIAYKLIRKLKDGSLSPLFINKKSRIPIGEWLYAEEHPTKGFATRKGWHCTLKPIAPHLSTKNRTWVEVEVEDTKLYNRPESQGGTWVLAQKMKVIRELNNTPYFKCDICGKFISYHELQKDAISEFIPETHLTYEKVVWTHKKCADTP